MVDLNSTIAIIAFNLKTDIKNRYYHVGLGGKKDSTRYCL